MSKPRRIRNRLNGWVLLDKPVGLTSTQALAVVKRALCPEKAGHGGTLDPLATGLLPIALGEATKAIHAAMDGTKTYQFSITWGQETATHDREGEITERADQRPSDTEIEALLPRYTGRLTQVPPSFSAIKVNGERAYDLARDGEEVVLPSREVEIHSLRYLGRAGSDVGHFEAQCGKGTYIRALARDMGRDLGCYGHISQLRRTHVAPFGPEDLVPLSAFQGQEPEEALPAQEDLRRHILPVQTILKTWPQIRVDASQAQTLRNGQPILARGASTPLEAEAAYAMSGKDLVALGSLSKGRFTPKRVFRL